MKKILAWLLLLTLVVGMFAGCKKADEATPTAPQGETTGSAQDAIDYLKAYYTNNGAETPIDYTRFGIVRIAGVAYDVVWTVDVGEDLIKIVKNEDGTYTIDVNEDAAEETPYKLTATVTDAQGNTASYTWDYILPKAQDMVAIVEAAYALENGKSLPYESRLRGKVVSLDTPYSEDYQNITVTIAIEGAEDKPIKCYRMKATADTAEAIKNVSVGNIITVTGTLKNYQGTIEFDTGCLMIAWEKGDAVDAPTDPGEILKAAYALGQDQSLPYVATLTGTVTEIDSPYDPAYGNISVVIVVEGYEQYPILCYRLKGLGVDQIAVNDLITVTGIIKNYKGTIEYDAGCQMTNRVSGGGVAQGPSSDPNKIIPDALKLNPGEKLPYRATLTGVITSVDNAYDPNYGNVTVTIKVNGYKFQCYRMVGEGVDKIRESDTITVSGIIENYNGKLEFSAKCNLDSWSMGPRPVGYGPLSEGVAYRLYMNQKALEKTLYFNGTYSGSRLNSTDKGSKGADIFLETVSGRGVRFYFMEGNAKKYIEIEEYTNDKGQQRGRALVTDSPSCVWNYNSDLGIYIVNLPTAGKYFLGTYNTYETFTASWVGYIDGTMSGSNQYIAKFMKASDVPVEEPSDTIVQGTAVDQPVPGTAYKFGFYQNQVEGKPFLSFAGKMAGFYYATSDKLAEMTDVYLEEAEGGYYIYFMDGNTKTYLDIVPRDNDPTKVNVVLNTSGAHTVYSLNTEHKYVYANAVDAEWYLGTFGTNTTISASKTSYISDTSIIGVSQFCAWFCEAEEVAAPEEPDVPDEPVEPGAEAAVVDDPVVETPYKLGMDKGDGKVLYFTGNTESASVNYRLETTTDASKAIDVMLESADGGYRLYFMNNGVKTYIRVYHRTDGDPGYGKGSIELVTATPDEVMTFDETAKTLIYDYDGNNAYYMGTYSTFVTISVSNTFYITGNNAGNVDVSQFPVRFYTVEEGEPSDPEPSEPSEPSVEAGVVEDPVVETPYKLGMDKGDGKVLYFTGNTESASVNYRLETTTDASKAIDVMLESADGGYRLYFMNNGVKTYIRVYHRTDGEPGYGKGSIELVTTTPDEVMTYDETAKTLIYDYDGNNAYYMGTYSTFVTISVSNTFYITGNNAANVDVTQFPVRFYTVEEGSEPEATEPTDPQPSEPAGEVGVVEDPVVETPYKLGMDKGDGKVLYFTGNTESASVNYRLETTTDASKAIDVMLESADGGYRLYFMNNGVKTYIRVYHRTDGEPGYGKGSIELVTTTPDEVMTYDETAKTLIYDYDGNNAYYMGTYSTFVTISVSNTFYITGNNAANVDVTQFPVRFYTVEEGSEPEATEPTNPQPSEPVTGDGFVKVTNASQFTSGQYVMIVNTGYAPGAVDGTWLTAVQPVVSGNVVTDTKDAVWTLTVTGNQVTIADANGTLIGPKGGNNNGLTTNKAYSWSWTFENGTFVFAGNDSDTVYLASNSSTTGEFPGNHRFRGYKTSTVSKYPAEYPYQFTLYKLNGEYVEPEVTEPVATEPTNPSVPSVSAGVVADPQAGTAYKMGMDKGDGKVLYFTGNTESASVNYRLETTTDISNAVDVKLEAANGGYRLFFMKDGVKTYIRVYQRTAGEPGYGKGSLEFVTAAPSEVMTYDKAANTLIYTFDGDNAYYMGTYGTFSTFSVSNTFYITGNNAANVDVSQYPARFYAVEESSEPEATEPEATEPEATEPEATEPEATQPSAGTTATYTFSNYGPGTQYTEGETYDLDKSTSLYLVGGHMNTQLRLYDDDKGDAQAIFTCAKAISSVVINAGHRAASLNVYASVDGETWVLIETIATERITVVSDYPSYTVEIPADAAYKYLKLDAVGAQIRIPYMTFNFAN